MLLKETLFYNSYTLVLLKKKRKELPYVTQDKRSSMMTETLGEGLIQLSLHSYTRILSTRTLLSVCVVFCCYFEVLLLLLLLVCFAFLHKNKHATIVVTWYIFYLLFSLLVIKRFSPWLYLIRCAPTDQYLCVCVCFILLYIWFCIFLLGLWGTIMFVFLIFLT